MTESIRTTWNDDHDAAFFRITDALAADGFATAARIDKMLNDLAASESWESMALRSASLPTPHQHELIPAQVIAPRRAG